VTETPKTPVAFLTPGMRVRHPQAPEWGIGQVQSVIAGRIAVTFEHAGKVVIDGSRVALEVLWSDE
jgi:hypothetical protein